MGHGYGSPYTDLPDWPSPILESYGKPPSTFSQVCYTRNMHIWIYYAEYIKMWWTPLVLIAVQPWSVHCWRRCSTMSVFLLMFVYITHIGLYLYTFYYGNTLVMVYDSWVLEEQRVRHTLASNRREDRLRLGGRPNRRSLGPIIVMYARSY